MISRPLFFAPGAEKMKKCRCSEKTVKTKGFGLKQVSEGALYRPRAAPKHFRRAETCLESFLGAAKSRSRVLFSGSGGLQERSRSSPRGLRGPKPLQEPSKRPPGGHLEPFWSRFGAILEPFLEQKTEQKAEQKEQTRPD